MKTIISTILFIFCLLLFTAYWYRPKPQFSTIYNPPAPIQKTEIIPKKQDIPLCVSAINDRNTSIQTIWSDVDMLIQGHKTTAQISYQKTKNFRMVVHSLTGIEADIGSNDTYFWFWSKRMNPPILYFAKHDNLFNTGLKTPFNPQWMVESLSVNAIKTNEVIFQTIGNRVAVKQLWLSPLRELISKITLIDASRNIIIGHYLYRNETLIASTEVVETYPSGFPKKIQILWHEENVSIVWTFRNPKVNANLNPQLWQMPLKNSIELGR